MRSVGFTGALEHGGRKGLKPVNKGASKNCAISDVDITEGKTVSPPI